MSDSSPLATPKATQLGGRAPLADRIRPKNLEEFIGQEHLVGSPRKAGEASGPIRKMIEKGEIFSMIFWGPPGVGKTTLARIIAKSLKADYHELSAVSAKKEDIREIIERPQQYASRSRGLRPRVTVSRLRGSGVPADFSIEKSGFVRTILFLDEIHRFNKAQQDFLLPYVETGVLTLIGATTENPSFEVISPLLSRCRTYVFKGLSEEDLGKMIERGLKEVKLQLNKEAMELLIQYSNGDGRTALNVIELTAKLSNSNIEIRNSKQSNRILKLENKITREKLAAIIQDKRLRYDTTGEEHFNTISAFIKSMRASDADAALYYLARMVEAGEDPLFIARRMVVFASEDIGMALPTALVVANAVFRACETIGYPECQENLAAGVVYLAKAPKDRRAYDAYMKALGDVKDLGNLPIPMSIRNPVTKLMKGLGYGKGYEKYTKESLLPEKLNGKKYYRS